MIQTDRRVIILHFDFCILYSSTHPLQSIRSGSREEADWADEREKRPLPARVPPSEVAEHARGEDALFFEVAHLGDAAADVVAGDGVVGVADAETGSADAAAVVHFFKPDVVPRVEVPDGVEEFAAECEEGAADLIHVL